MGKNEEGMSERKEQGKRKGEREKETRKKEEGPLQWNMHRWHSSGEVIQSLGSDLSNEQSRN